MAKKTNPVIEKKEIIKMTKVIKMLKSKKSGSYIFYEKIINSNKINDFFKE